MQGPGETSDVIRVLQLRVLLRKVTRHSEMSTGIPIFSSIA
jgi:hypothetical protein